MIKILLCEIDSSHKGNEIEDFRYVNTVYCPSTFSLNMIFIAFTIIPFVSKKNNLHIHILKILTVIEHLFLLDLSGLMFAVKIFRNLEESLCVKKLQHIDGI